MSYRNRWADKPDPEKLAVEHEKALKLEVLNYAARREQPPRVFKGFMVGLVLVAALASLVLVGVGAIWAWIGG